MKVPAILYYERADMRDRLNLDVLPKEVDVSILCRDINIAMSVFIIVTYELLNVSGVFAGTVTMHLSSMSY